MELNSILVAFLLTLIAGLSTGIEVLLPCLLTGLIRLFYHWP